jgi:hypothetical protein
MSSHSVSSADILPFLRWLVYHHHTTKKATAFTAVSVECWAVKYELKEKGAHG